MNVTLLRCLYAGSLLAMSASLSAQAVDESALDELDKKTAPVIQPVREPPGAVELRAAIRRIAQSPSDADALADAGNASLTLGDANAALNFFTRANALRPNNGRIISGLATATVRTENPFEALRLFDDAVRLGISERAIAADRALAFDLLGNFGRAQQDYKLARTAATSEDLLIRQAISLSLAGQKAESDAMLVPLLQKNSASAWRARAFMLAARGEFRESTKVTQGFMDAGSAQRMERYLRLMPELTGAQQAAAIHLGHFPASHNVGRDSEQVRRVASNIPAVEPAKNESRLIPTGTPLGTNTTKAKVAKEEKKPVRRRDRKAQDQEAIKLATANIPESIKLPKTDTSRLGTETARVKVEEAKSSAVVIAKTTELPPPESARPLVKVEVPVATANVVEQPNTQVVTPSVQPASIWSPGTNGGLPDTVSAGQTAVATTPPPTNLLPASIPVPIEDAATRMVATQGPLPSGETVATTSIPAETAPVIAAANVEPVEARPTPAFDLASIVGSIEIPESEQKPSAVPVDLKKLKPATPKVAEVAVKSGKPDPKATKAAPPANPARQWVQIATGAENALGFDFRRLAKKSPELFKGKEGWTSAWGKTSRLLVGPFTDVKDAKKWEADFRKGGGGGFVWKSDDGTVVTKLKSK
jgi:tetratricopeptide (TPR) repeat protein